MKRINIVCITLLMILLGVNTSCADYLDKAPDEDLTLDDVFTRENYAEQFLSSIYWNMPWELNFTNDWGHNPFVGAADELDYPYTNCFAYFMNNGSWTPDNVLKDISNMAYQGIRKTNIFLENVAKVPMDESKRAGCPMSALTLSMGIERILKEHVPGVTRVEQVNASGETDDLYDEYAPF